MAADRVRIVRDTGTLGFLSVVTFFGALIHFLHTADGFGGVVLAVLEAAVWPAIVVFHVLRVLSA